LPKRLGVHELRRHAVSASGRISRHLSEILGSWRIIRDSVQETVAATRFAVKLSVVKNWLSCHCSLVTCRCAQ